MRCDALGTVGNPWYAQTRSQGSSKRDDWFAVAAGRSVGSNRSSHDGRARRADQIHRLFVYTGRYTRGRLNEPVARADINSVKSQGRAVEEDDDRGKNTGNEKTWMRRFAVVRPMFRPRANAEFIPESFPTDSGFRGRGTSGARSTLNFDQSTGTKIAGVLDRLRTRSVVFFAAKRARSLRLRVAYHGRRYSVAKEGRKIISIDGCF